MKTAMRRQLAACVAAGGLALASNGAWSTPAPRPATAAPASQIPAEQAQSSRLWFGAAWYPEQWPQDHWERDLQLMEHAGFNVVRIGEFAWSSMEPREGVYDFAWLERAIRMAERHGVKVVLGTPTDAPPAWLTTNYPQVLRVGADGLPSEHGARRQFNYASAEYRALSRRIVGEMVRRFGHDANVIGWQIGNEYTDESFDEGSRRQFQDWLHARYGTLEALNAAWTTAYWSQTYSDWSQVPLNADPGNPGWMMDHRRFVTDTWRAFQKAQLDVIHAGADPRQFTTTNVGGLGIATNWDKFAINADLDVASWDPYVGTGHLDPARSGLVNDAVRGWKRKNFWVMETQPGFVNWSPLNNVLFRGETRAMAWSEIGHGADAVLYWQWRSALNGQEQYHGAIVGPDGEPLPLYAEIQEIGRDLKAANGALVGTSPQAEVAMISTYESRWAIEFQPHTKFYDQLAVQLDLYRPLKDRVGAVDVVHAAAPLSSYKVVFAPSLNVISDALGRHLADYVRGGGHLVIGPRAGLKDEADRLDPRRQPGPLADLLGGRVEQFYALDAPVALEGSGGVGQGSTWAEVLSPTSPETDVLLRYGKAAQSWLSGRPAVVQRRVGRGVITYLGVVPDAALARQLVDAALKDAAVETLFPVPEAVEVMRRVGAGREVLVLVNHSRATRKVDLPGDWTDVLAGGGGVRRVELGGEDVAVVSRPLP